MSKYRFKTQEEFERDGHWNDEYQCPIDWAESGEMNHYLGEDVPIYLYERCDVGGDFSDDGWCFQPTDYILKEEDYTGRWIKAIVDNPSCTSVKLGEIIQIISKPGCYRLDKTSRGYSGMTISCPLDTSKWELVEQPKDDSDDILKKARRLYPIGTEFISNLGSFGGNIQTVKAELNWYNENKDSISHPGIGWVYFDGKWAEIVEPDPCQDVSEYVKCIKVPDGWSSITKKDTIYKTDKYPDGGYRILYHDVGGGQTTEGKEHCFVSATKQEYDAQFLNEQDPLYICKQKYRKGIRVISAAKAGVYSGEFIIDVDPKEFRNLSGNKDVVDYSFSKGYLYYNGQYAEILEEGIYDISEIIKTNKPSVDDYLANSGFKESNPEAYNWLMDKPKPSIEFVHSVDIKLRTKKQINKHLKF
jgi:hypothetical protein